MPNQAVVIGAGIVGLHAAAALQAKGFTVVVLEAESHFGHHTSGRNSGVLHAGIFYEPDSLKEKTCLEGNAMSREWFSRLGVPFRPCGKWLLSQDRDIVKLEEFLHSRKRLPQVGLRLCSPDEVARDEPQLEKQPAIFVATTGLLDAAAYVRAMVADLERQGAGVLCDAKATGVSGQILHTTRGEIEFDVAVNAAGLYADEVIAWTKPDAGWEIRPCRGDYWLLPAQPFARPVYHIPDPQAPGLGVHFTPTFDGSTLLGPNAFFISDKNDYRHVSAADEFAEAAAIDMPTFAGKPLTPGYSGNRPKLFKNNKAIKEFQVFRDGAWIHLLGIESPGLTAAPALGRMVAELATQ